MKNFDNMSRAAQKKVGIEGWDGYDFESVAGGIIVTGAVHPKITRGPNKGQPNYRKPLPGTKRKVVLSKEDLSQ